MLGGSLLEGINTYTYTAAFTEAQRRECPVLPTALLVLIDWCADPIVKSRPKSLNTVSVQSIPMFSQCRCNTTSWPHKDEAASPPTIAIITGV
jgi:hypothetical protein